MVLRVTQQATEVLLNSNAGQLRVSKQHVEVLRPAETDIFATASSDLGLTPGMTVMRPWYTLAESTLNLSSALTWLGPRYRIMASRLHLSQTANGYHGTPWAPVEFEHVLSFAQALNLTLPALADNTLNFADEAYRLQTPNSSIAFTQGIDSGKSKDVDESEMSLAQNVATSSEFVRVEESADFIGHSLTYYVESPCSTKAYTPFVGENTIPNVPAPPDDEQPIVQADPTGTRFQLSYPALAAPTDTVVLRAPELDNIDRLAFTRISRETRGGKLSVFADPAWPETETVIVTFIGLIRAEIESLQTFFVAHIGEEIGMQDWEGREWVGIVTTPNESAINDGGRNVCGGKGWTITFEFEGVLVDGHAPNDSLGLSQIVSTVVVGP